MMKNTDADHTAALWFALLLTLANGSIDAYTYLARGGVFANVQTANVILFAIDASEGKTSAALAHVWPLLAFVAGMLLASHIRTGRAERHVRRPLLWTMAVQSSALAVIGLVPVSAPHNYVTIPISFLAAMQMGLFRRVGDLAYLPVATTGNLMRFMEAAYDGFVDRQPAQRRAAGVYGALIAAFVTGALIGALATDRWSARAIWIAAGLLAVTVVVFALDQRRRTHPGS
ncbi:MAG: YoaK family protein [Mycobacterium kyogaense]